MYTKRSGLVLGFHGCDRTVAEQVISGQEELNFSINRHDWLGHGIYFWEHSPSRALEYAQTLKIKPARSKHPITEPAVIGAVIDLNYCFDLLDYDNLKYLKKGHSYLVEACKQLSINLPANKTVQSSQDLLIRELDCAVIETLHTMRKKEDDTPFDTVRGVFSEGEELYANAGFRNKDHIQICVRNRNCIKGYFWPKQELSEPFIK